MPLPRDTRLGPFEIRAPLGAGGLGEVYRATDTRLSHTAAIKVLPERLSQQPDPHHLQALSPIELAPYVRGAKRRATIATPSQSPFAAEVLQRSIQMIAFLMGLKTVSPKELKQAIDQHQVTVIDVNSPQSWNRGHVPGAINLDPAAYQSSDLPQDKNARLVFYCSNPMCTKAPNAARLAKKMGYTNVQVMSAGISGWLSANLPTESAPRATAPQS